MERAGALIGKLKLPAAIADPETRVRAAWAVAAGKKIARHTRATILVRDTLVVEVEDMVWQRQLATLRPILVHNLNKILGEALVADIDFRPTPARRKAQMAQAARPDSAGNTDEASSITDPVMQMLYRQARRKERA
jgi:hypothetical protein